MAAETFQLTAVIRSLNDTAEIADVLGIPEVSALGGSEREWRACLQAKAKSALEDHELCPSLLLYRRRFHYPVELAAMEVCFPPPRRSADWEQPVTLNFRFVRWMENGLFRAFVPGLQAEVFAHREDLLAKRVEEHIRLLLPGRGRRISLQRLAELERVTEIRIDQIETAPNRKTPKQIEAAARTAKDADSILEKVAEELPPRMEARRGESPKEAAAEASVVQAFEMEAEVRSLAEALSGAHARSVLIVGPPGCGKTALVREMARRRRDFGLGQTPFWTTSGVRLMAGPIGFGMWQERCQTLCAEVSKGRGILHVNHLGELVEMGKSSRNDQSIGRFLRPWIARGDITVVAECDAGQFAALSRDEPQLLGVFQHLHLNQRDPSQTLAILRQVVEGVLGKAPSDAKFDRALLRLHQLHQRYATYSANPGRPLRFLKHLLNDRKPSKAITEEGVIRAFSRETGLPEFLLNDSRLMDIPATREWFSNRVIGQPEAVERVVDLLTIIKARLGRPQKPLASFLFIGPTGTGKTELAKALASFLFGDASRMVRFDLNQFGDPASVQRLIDSAGTGGDEGLLTARIREQPFSVVLFDEFEKAESSFFDLLLQALGDGRLTDASGRVADFCNCVIIMTSNLGAQDFQRGAPGFRADGAVIPEANDHFSSAVGKFLRPEIFNRLDAIVPFQALTREMVLAIANRHLELLRRRDGLRLRPVSWQVEKGVAEYLAARGFDPRHGARPLKRTIERELIVPLAEALNRYRKDTEIDVRIDVSDERIRIGVRARVSAPSRMGRAAKEAAAGSVVAERRRVVRLRQSSATAKIENEAAMLETLERRLAAKRTKTPEAVARLAPLPHYRKCLEAVAALVERAAELEGRALSRFYQRDSFDEQSFAPELTGIETERRRLAREIFKLQMREPDEVVLGFYSEDRSTLIQFARAYFELGSHAGRATQLDFFTAPSGGAAKGSAPIRGTALKPAEWLAAPPEKLIGIALHLSGDLFFARFGPEAGQHIIDHNDGKLLCLIETQSPPLAAYHPPERIGRKGGIQNLGRKTQRTFHEERRVVEDKILGNRPWTALGIDKCVAELTEQRLERAIEEMMA